MAAEPRAPVSVRIEPAPGVDAALVAGVANAAFSVHELVRGPRTSPEGVLREAGDDSVFLFAEDGPVLGLAMVRTATAEHFGFGTAAVQRLAEQGIPATGDLYFGMASVLPEAQRRGIGRALINAAERYAADTGFSRVVLTTVRELGNVQYYERAGYTVVASEVFPPGHYSIPIEHESCLMVKQL